MFRHFDRQMVGGGVLGLGQKPSQRRVHVLPCGRQLRFVAIAEAVQALVQLDLKVITDDVGYSTTERALEGSC